MTYSFSELCQSGRRQLTDSPLNFLHERFGSECCTRHFDGVHTVKECSGAGFLSLMVRATICGWLWDGCQGARTFLTVFVAWRQPAAKGKRHQRHTGDGAPEKHERWSTRKRSGHNC